MAKTLKELTEWFDLILQYLWDATSGAATSKQQAVKGVARLSKFLLSEMSRRDKLRNEGERALARRGMAIPDSVLDSWIWNTLEECRVHMIPPPRALLELVYRRLGCSHLEQAGSNISREQRESAVASVKRGVSLRDVAKRYEVNATTVLRWTGEGSHEFDLPFYHELRRVTQVNAFYPPGWWRSLEQEDEDASR